MFADERLGRDVGGGFSAGGVAWGIFRTFWNGMDTNIYIYIYPGSQADH